jgi:hypothetical protein
MDLELRAYLAVLNVRKAHQEIELIDYARVMKRYDPDVPNYELILNKFLEITTEIERLDKLIKEIK